MSISHQSLERKGALTLKEINDYYQYSSLHEGEDIHPRTFLRYKEYIDETFPCYIQFAYSLSPLPLPCHLQSPDNQVVLQGGNGDKGFKKYV
ncbi:MAG: hypothetical protein IJ190_01195 [Prevotella sp.]|nr:hypothetical protein [Prevotella sp.]MBQ9229772.1 hypothetical protein [Prevotella sp.]